MASLGPSSVPSSVPSPAADSTSTDSVSRRYVRSHLSAEEERYLLDGIKENIRIDGRALSCLRPLKMSVDVLPSCFGSAQISNGESSVMVGVKGDLLVPPLTRPDEGTIVVSASFAFPTAIETELKAEGQNPSSLISYLVSSIASSLDSCSIPKTSLCVLPNRFAWTIYVDIVIFSVGGSLLDVTSVAAKCALMNTKLPIVTVCVGDEEMLDDMEDPENDELGSSELGDVDQEVISTEESSTDDITTSKLLISAGDDSLQNLVPLQTLNLLKPLRFRIETTKMRSPFPHASDIGVYASLGVLNDSYMVLDMSRSEAACAGYHLCALVGPDGRIRSIRKSGSSLMPLSVFPTALPSLEQLGSSMHKQIDSSLKLASG